MKPNYLNKLFIKFSVILVLLLIISAPLPFLSNLLISEEGCFAYLVVDNGKNQIPDNHNMILIGRKNGEDRFEAPRHPIIPYWLMTTVLRSYRGPVNFDTLTIEEKTVRARFPLYTLYALGWFIAFIGGAWMFRAQRFVELVLPLSFIALAGTWRLLVGGAAQTYYDGNLGIFLISLCALGLSKAHYLRNSIHRWGVLFLSGFTATLGKNEWALALLAAALAAIGLRSLFLRFLDRTNAAPDAVSATKIIFQHVIPIITGILSGSILHYLLDPFNYTNGFSVMRAFGIGSTASWSHALGTRIPFIWPFALLILLAFFLIRPHLKRLFTDRLPAMILLLWGTAMLVGFMIPPHTGDGFPRYFCPAMMAFIVFLISEPEYWSPIRLQFKPLIIIGIIILSSFIFNIEYLARNHSKNISIGTLPGRDLIRHRSMFKRQYMRFRQTGQVQKVDAALGYYFPKMDFLNNT